MVLFVYKSFPTHPCHGFTTYRLYWVGQKVHSGFLLDVTEKSRQTFWPIQCSLNPLMFDLVISFALVNLTWVELRVCQFSVTGLRETWKVSVITGAPFVNQTRFFFPSTTFVNKEIACHLKFQSPVKFPKTTEKNMNLVFDHVSQDRTNKN